MLVEVYERNKSQRTAEMWCEFSPSWLARTPGFDEARHPRVPGFCFLLNNNNDEAGVEIIPDHAIPPRPSSTSDVLCDLIPYLIDGRVVISCQPPASPGSRLMT